MPEIPANNIGLLQDRQDASVVVWHPAFEKFAFEMLPRTEFRDLAYLLPFGIHRFSSAETVINITTQLAHTIQGLRKNDIVHHNIAPQDILINNNMSRAVLIGFENASKKGEAFDSRFGFTPAYIPPERVRMVQNPETATEYTEASDVYSLAIITYEMFIGTSLFPDESVENTYNAIVNFNPNNPKKYWKENLAGTLHDRFNMDENRANAIADILARALSTEPEERFDTCIDFAEALTHAGEILVNDAVAA